jgi:predicted MarR family transcription regulator
MDTEDRVLLLALYKKERNESFNDILLMLESSNLFRLKEGKKRLKKLQKDGFITSESLTILGIERAKEIEEEFKL